MANTIVKTPIVYYGGKTSIINHLLELEPLHSKYGEAFCGGATFFFHKETIEKHEVINDKLDIVVNFYTQLKLNFKKLKRLIDASVFARTQLKRANHIFMSHKIGFPVDKLELAWAFWYSCHVSYSQKLYSSGMKFSIEGDNKAAVLQKKKALFTDQLAARIEHVHIECADFRYFYKKRTDADWFHFDDPPYFNTDMGHYGGFTENDTIDLLDIKKGSAAKFILTSYKSDLLMSYIKQCDWNFKEVDHGIKHPRKSSNGASKKTEVVVWNYANTCNTLSLFN